MLDRNFLMTCTIVASVALSAWPSRAIAKAQEEFLSRVRQLTFEGLRSGEGYYSANGSKLIFQSERESDNPFYQIYTIDLETGDFARVSPGHGKTTCETEGGTRLPRFREAAPLFLGLRRIDGHLHR